MSARIPGLLREEFEELFARLRAKHGWKVGDLQTLAPDLFPRGRVFLCAEEPEDVSPTARLFGAVAAFRNAVAPGSKAVLDLTLLYKGDAVVDPARGVQIWPPRAPVA